jgi:hypothetical protein
MYSFSAISTTEPPTSLFDRSIAVTTSRSASPYAWSRCGSSTTWYCLTNPPIGATSATPSTLASGYRRYQSCKLRSDARSCPDETNALPVSGHSPGRSHPRTRVNVSRRSSGASPGFAYHRSFVPSCHRPFG